MPSLEDTANVLKEIQELHSMIRSQKRIIDMLDERIDELEQRNEEFDIKNHLVEGDLIKLIDVGRRIYKIEATIAQSAFELSFLTKTQVRISPGYLELHGNKSVSVSQTDLTLVGSTPFICIEYVMSSETATIKEFNSKPSIVQGENLYIVLWQLTSPASGVYKIVRDHRTGINAINILKLS